MILDPKEIIYKIKLSIKNKGPFGLRGLAKAFKKLDKDRSGNLNLDELKWGLRSYGIYVTNEEALNILNFFDKNKNGVIEFKEFVETLRG